MTDRPAIAGARALGAGLLVGAVVVVLDQVVKWAVLAHVMQPPRVIEVAPFFNLVLAWNRGISFGMFGGGVMPVWALAALALAIVAFLGVWLWRTGGWVVVVGIGSIIGGAVGNVIDRLRFGAVADFLDFHVMGHHWPAFNVADTAISVGAAILVLESLFAGRERPKNGEDAPSGASDSDERTER